MTRPRLLGLCVLILLIAAGVRVWQLGAQSLWFDEGIAWHAATRPALAAALADDPTNPPLYFLLLFGWVRLAGDSEFALRALSLLQGLLLVALMGHAARRWFGRRAGVLALALGALTPLLWWASQEIRMYTQIGLLGLLLALGLIEILGPRRPIPRWAWIALLLGEIGALYSHNTGSVALGAVNLVAGLAWLIAARYHPDWRFVARWIAGQGLVVILWLPELLARFANVGADNAATLKPPPLSLNLIWQSWQALWASSWEMVRANPPELQTIAIVLLPLAIMALAALRIRSGRMLLGLIGALYLVLIAALGVIGVDLHGRYLVLIAPLLIVAIAGGITRFNRRGTLRWLLPAAAVIGVGVAWLGLPGGNRLPYQHDQARELVAHYAETLGPDDLVLAWTYAERYDLMYYWDRLGVQARRIELPEGANAAEVLARVNPYLPPGEPVRVERSVWFMQGADAQGMLPCLLGQGQTAQADTYVVNGMASTGYEIEGPLTTPALESTVANFGVLALDGAAVPSRATAASRAICLPLTLTMETTTVEDLRVALRVLTPYGAEFAAADAPLMTAAQVPTSRLQPGDRVEAYPLLTFLQGTPPGSYELRLRVYSANQPSGLDVLAADGAPLGKDATLGQVDLSAGTWPPFAGDCDLAVGPGLRLTNCGSLPTGPLQPGQTIDLSLNWQIETTGQVITLTLTGDGWAASDTATPSIAGAVLNWHQLRVPAEARGTARLTAQVDDHAPVELGVYTLEPPDHLMTAPEVATPSGIALPGLGTLYGFSAPEELVSGADPFDVTLVWQAQEPTPIAYTVTVQLLDPDGRLLAQHDSVPAGGTRPTTGWQSGEYIIDSHTVEFREDGQDYSGPASLIVAVYDPATGARLTTSSGDDHIMLLESVRVTRP